MAFSRNPRVGRIEPSSDRRPRGMIASASEFGVAALELP